MRSRRRQGNTDSLTVLDSSPFPSTLTTEQLTWLRELGCRLVDSDLIIHLTGAAHDEQDPVIRFDESTGTWWSGRYVGAIKYKGYTLTILPRYEFALNRWMTRIWGCRLDAMVGEWQNSHIWIWTLIARVWAQQLAASAKHGLPFVRVEEQYVGPALRGRLNVYLTSVEMARGSMNLVGTSRVRKLDDDIGGVLWLAYTKLRNELNGRVPEKMWLSERGTELTKQLRVMLPPIKRDPYSILNRQIRYTPMTESYRKCVNLSKAIIQQRSFSSSVSGEDDVLGALIDIAEIWEAYVFHLVHEAMPSSYKVIHAGRDSSNEFHLLNSFQGAALAALRPDILIRRESDIASVIDAKYKSTIPNSTRPNGLHREDLYQMTAYLAALGNPQKIVPGILVYPDDGTGKISEYQEQGQWRIKGSNSRTISFLGIWIAGEDDEILERAERDFQNRVRALIEV